jgi:GT2 family glycosyltransferase
MKIELPRVSIIIPTYKDWDRLQLCLDALNNQSVSKDIFEIIVVNNEPNISTPNHLVIPENCSIVEEIEPGSYAARNKALSIAKGDIIGFTDSDCIPDMNWISNALMIFDSSKNIDRIAGEVVIFRELNSSWLAWKFESITAFNQKYNVANGVSITANLFVKRKIFDDVGLFDDKLFSGGDIEWNKRASLKGCSLVFSDQVLVNHPARQSMKEIIQKSRRVIGGLYLQFCKQGRFGYLYYALRQLVPPVKFALVLIKDDKSILWTIFACFIYWAIKFLMLIEIIRLRLGGTPLRQ